VFFYYYFVRSSFFLGLGCFFGLGCSSSGMCLAAAA
jgi:hypothetical protein